MSGPFKLKYTKGSFPFKSLEEELITGAGEAAATDPEGLVSKAQEKTSEKLTESIKSVGGALSDEEKEEGTEEETEE